MTWQAWLFLALPPLAGGLAGRFVKSWSVAAAMLFAAVIMLWVIPTLPQTTKPVATPLVTGTGMACAALALLLAARPQAGFALRSVAGAATAFASHFLYLQYALAVR